MDNDRGKFFIADEDWGAKYPGAKAGILVMKNIENAGDKTNLNKIAQEEENKLREIFKDFTRDQINDIPIIKIYNNYYKNFSKTYHVRSQVESVINGKSLSSGSQVVTAMFIAEVKNMLLTAGHDLGALVLPIHLKVGDGKENFIDIRGAEKTVVEGDMVMSDGKGIISSIILGPDSRTKLTQNAKNVLFAVYAPREIEKDLVMSHLKDIESYVKSFSPNSETEFVEVFEAN